MKAIIHYRTCFAAHATKKGEGPMWPDVSTNVVQAGIGSYVALA